MQRKGIKQKGEFQLISVHCGATHFREHFLTFEPFSRITPSTLMNEEDVKQTAAPVFKKSTCRGNGRRKDGKREDGSGREIEGVLYRDRSTVPTDYH